MGIGDLYATATGEAKLRDEYATYTARKTSIGMVRISSGRIVACDPFMISDEDRPFHQEVPVGEYPVSLLIAKNLENNDERVAAAFIGFSSLWPEKWVMATKGNQDLRSLRENHIYGYGVDSGTGSFLDADAAKVFVQNFMENERYFDYVIGLFEKNYSHTRSWMIYEVDPARKLNVAMFSSGYGDGFYPSYWGYAADHAIVCLGTDFGVLGSAQQVE